MRKERRKLYWVKKEKKKGLNIIPEPLKPEIKELAIYCTVIALIEGEKRKNERKAGIK